MPVSNKKRLSLSHIIQDWHVVLGDTHARSGRTTVATELLRSIKEKFKNRYKGEKRSTWIPLAIKDLYESLRESFPTSKFPTIQGEVGLVLVKCTAKSMDRIDGPCVYAYKGDKEASFGTAKAQVALEFFLASRDAPVLAHELARHVENLTQLRNSELAPPKRMMDDFQMTLGFFQRKLEDAEQPDSILPSKLLESLKPINALKEQWKLLVAHKPPIVPRVGSPENDQDRKWPRKPTNTDTDLKGISPTNGGVEHHSAMRSGSATVNDCLVGSGACNTAGSGFASASLHQIRPSATGYSTKPDPGPPQQEAMAALLFYIKQQQALGNLLEMPSAEVPTTNNQAVPTHANDERISPQDSPNSSKRISRTFQNEDTVAREMMSPKRVKNAHCETDAETDTSSKLSKGPASTRNSTVLPLASLVASQTNVLLATTGFFPYPCFREYDMNPRSWR